MIQKLSPIHRIIIPVAIAAMCSGCAPMLQVEMPPSEYHKTSPEPGIVVMTHQKKQMTFRDGWSLTLEGIAGTAEYTDDLQHAIVADTTLSYGDVVSAAPARGSNTMRQFLLTILGVILLIGLAAIILYAAFIATGR